MGWICTIQILRGISTAGKDLSVDDLDRDLCLVSDVSGLALNQLQGLMAAMQARSQQEPNVFDTAKCEIASLHTRGRGQDTKSKNKKKTIFLKEKKRRTRYRLVYRATYGFRFYNRIEVYLVPGILG